MTKVIKNSKPPKRKSTVVSTQTYRKMVEEALEEAPAAALDLHGIYEALALKYDQYREDSVEVDWRNSIRHCLSINDNFIRVLPEAIRLTFFSTDPDNAIFQREINGEFTVVRSFWTTAALIRKHHWQPFIMNTASNIKKALRTEVIRNESEILPPPPLMKPASKPPVISSFNIKPYNPNFTSGHVPITSRPSITDMLVSEWIDPSSFLDIAPSNTATESHSEVSSPMCVDSGTQAALFNIAVIEEDERILRMRHRLKCLQQTMPNVLGPLKIDFINVRIEKEPAQLPSPLKEVNTVDSPQMVSLPPIFNHPI